MIVLTKKNKCKHNMVLPLVDILLLNYDLQALSLRGNNKHQSLKYADAKLGTQLHSFLLPGYTVAQWSVN